MTNFNAQIQKIDNGYTVTTTGNSMIVGGFNSSTVYYETLKEAQEGVSEAIDAAFTEEKTAK